MLSVGVTGLRRETGRHWHLAVINEVTFPTAPAAIEKNLFHFKVTSGGRAEERWGWWTDRRTDGWLHRSVGLVDRSEHLNATCGPGRRFQMRKTVELECSYCLFTPCCSCKGKILK